MMKHRNLYFKRLIVKIQFKEIFQQTLNKKGEITINHKVFKDSMYLTIFNSIKILQIRFQMNHFKVRVEVVRDLKAFFTMTHQIIIQYNCKLIFKQMIMMWILKAYKDFKDRAQHNFIILISKMNSNRKLKMSKILIKIFKIAM